MAKINFVKQYCLFFVPFLGYLAGWKLERIEDERLSSFRDKSALYRRDVPPDEPSW